MKRDRVTSDSVSIQWDDDAPAKKHTGEKAYADAEYFGVEYRNIELVNGRWYFQRRNGRQSAFRFQSRVNLLTEPRTQPRRRKTIYSK